MHDALRVDEILEIICSFADKKSLACLIRTCRTFEEPSRNVLWRELDSLIPVLRLFPNVWEIVHDGQLKFIRLRFPNDWERMRPYTSRVTKIRLELEPIIHVYGQIAIIGAYPPPDALFPKLQVIHSTLPLQFSTIPIFRWINGPSVVNVHLEIPYDSNENSALEFVASLSTLYPNATKVEIAKPDCGLDILDAHHTPNMPLCQSLSQAILGWKRLEEGSFFGVDTAAYEHLCRLDSLASLALVLQDNFIQYLREANLPSKPFPALNVLTIVANEVAHLSEWMDCLRLSPINLLCVTPEIVGRSEAEEHRLSSSIAATCCNRSLENIWLRAGRLRRNISLHISWIRPLFIFSRLRSVTLTSFCMIFIDDEGLQELASSWPLLEILHLNHSLPLENTEGRDDVIMPTFRGFLSLIKTCRRLRELSIVIDMRDSVWVDACDPCGVYNDVMINLSLGNSLVDDVDRVLMIFSSLFPVLSSFSLNGERLLERFSTT